MKRPYGALLAGLSVLFASAPAGAVELVLEPELGGSYANIVAFQNQELVPGVTIPGATNNKVFGWRFGAFGGLRFGIVTVGAHGALSRFSPYDVGSLGPEVRVRLPTPGVQPYARVQGGYAWLGSIDTQSVWRCSPTSTSAQCPSVAGWFLGAGLGLDVSLGAHLTVGGDLGLDVLNLTRSSVPTMVDLTQEGNAVGLQVTATAHAALRF